MAFARTYPGMHHLTDVVAGALLGVGALAASAFAVRVVIAVGERRRRTARRRPETNPRAGRCWGSSREAHRRHRPRRQVARRRPARLRERLVAEGYEDLIWYEVEKSRQAPKRVRRAIDEGASLLLVWGGDGMVQRSLDAAAHARAAATRHPPRRHGQPLRQQPRHTDRHRGSPRGGPPRSGSPPRRRAHQRERFGVMAGAGFDARMIAEVDKGMKERALADAWTGLRATRAGRQQMTVRVDGERWFKGKASARWSATSAPSRAASTPSTTRAPVRTTAGWRSASSPRRARGSGRGAVPHGRRPVRQVGAREHDERPPGRRPAQAQDPLRLDGGDRPPTRRLKIRRIQVPLAVTVRVPLATVQQ